MADQLTAPASQTSQRQPVPGLLSVRDLRVTYQTQRGKVHAVDGASFTVAQAEMIGLVGESGCGKTTVARALTGVMSGNARVTGGSIGFTDRDLLAMSASDRRAVRWREISFIPQSAMNSLDPVYRVERQAPACGDRACPGTRSAAGDRR
jgi:peptide/nickel transport system ATP-binding protein